MDSKSTLFQELNRRHFLQSVGIYVVASWLVLQVASLSFPGLNVDPSAIRYVWLGVILGFPLALVFAWRYNVSPSGIARTHKVQGQGDLSLTGADKLIIGGIIALSLAILAGVSVSIGGSRLGQIANSVSSSHMPSIAVLPFSNMSGDPSNDPITVGIHDDLLTHISRIRNVRVISRTSVARLNTSLSIPEIGMLLGVTTILEGGVQRYGDRLRINAQLIDAATDQHLWSEQFDRNYSVEEMFSIQTDIAAAISEKLKVTLSFKDQEKLTRNHPSSLPAYEAYLLGRQRLTLRTRESLYEAASYFEQAIALDNSYALAHVGLADAYLLLNNYGNIAISDALAVAKPALFRALAIDEQLGPAYASIGLSHARQGEFKNAEKAYRRSIELEPNYAAPYHWLGVILVDDLGRPLEAIPFLDKARDLDPLSPVIAVTLGEAQQAIGNFDSALHYFERAIKLDPAYPGAYFLMAQHHRLVKGDLPTAVQWFLRELEIDPNRDTTLLGLTFLDVGDTASAEYWIAKAFENMTPESFWPQASQVIIAAFKKEEELAVELARKLLQDFQGNNVSLFTLITYGHYQEAIDRFAPAYPELTCATEPKVTRLNLSQAINLSLAYEKLGFSTCSRKLLNQALKVTQSMPRLGNYGHGISDVEIYARQGDSQKALQTLRLAIDQNFRAFWWSQMVVSPHMDSIKDEPAYIEMTEEIRADMAMQRAKMKLKSEDET